MTSQEQRLNNLFIKTVSDNKIAMFRLAYSIVLNREDAEDIVGETILKAYSHLTDLRNQKKMKAWLFQILVNESKTCLKKRNRIELVEDTSMFVEEQETETMNDLLEFVYKLDDIFKEVTILYYFEEFSIREIANILHLSVGTVKSRLSRARAKIKKFLGNQDI